MLNFFKKLLGKQEPVETKTVVVLPLTDSITIEEQKPAVTTQVKGNPKKPRTPRKKR